MSDYQWCHGPECHKRRTTTRIRGVKGSKVLRTMKLKTDRVSVWKYFCDQTCMHNFIFKHINEFARLHPRPEALETPIDVVVETRTDWHGNPYKQKVIRGVDNA